MNIRKVFLCLFSGLFLCATVFGLLFPFTSNASADRDGQQKKSPSSGASQNSSAPSNYDAFLSAPATFADSAAERQPENGVKLTQFEPRLGVPTFVWASENQAVYRPAARQSARGVKAAEETAKAAARFYLGDNSAQYRLGKADAAAAEVASVHDTGRGAIIVKFKQNIGGVEVFRDELNVMMNRNLELIAISGYLTGTGDAASKSVFNLQPEAAVAAAVSDLIAAPVEASALLRGAAKFAANAKPSEKYLSFTAADNQVSGVTIGADTVRAKQVFFHLADGFVPAYYVEAQAFVPQMGAGVEDLYFSYVVSAVDGSILFRNNLTAHQSYSYRVFGSTTDLTALDGPQGNAAAPHPTGVPDNFSPALTTPNLVTLQNFPFSRNDAWLPANSTQTLGNNADAYVDLTAPDGFNAGDFRASTTAPGVFDNTFNPTAPRTDTVQRNFAIQQLFYNVNYLHDDFYDSGFNEISGNAQNDNFGRGGIGGDRIKAEAQDYSGRNNANMSTPADGGQPRMQMYLFDGPIIASLVINSPSSIAGQKAAGVATGFGPQSFDTTGDVVIAADGVGTTTDACSALTNGAAIAGKIAFIDRGSCEFVLKIRNAQNAGAIGVIIADNVAAAVSNIGGTATDITIPSVKITLADGNAIRNASGVNARLYREPTRDLDGTLDNQIVAHEWGHYISNRLIANSNGLINNQGRSMGEGWGDFHSMMLTVRADDINVPSNNNWNGVYGMAGYATGNGPNNSYYFGIRRIPYSTDFNKDPLTFKHIADGTALPTNAPIKVFGANSEVHNSGEIWTSMLWECYASLLRAYPFDEARSRMKSYLVASYKMTPVSPTYVEARDAVMAAAFASDPADGQRFAAAFAKRGIGVRAVAPDRASTTHTGVVESYNAGGDLSLVGGTVTDNSGDNDGYLDNGETGTLKITVKNTGFQSLSNSTATVSSSNSHITFPGGATVALSASQPFSSSFTATINVAASGMSGIETAVFTVTLNDPAITLAPPTGTVSARLNVNEVANSSTTDDVESLQTTWTRSSDTTLDPSNFGQWQRIRPAGGVSNQLWYGPNVGVASDQYLISPTLIVGATGGFSMTFQHSYDFETDRAATPAVYYDGGVVEMSLDGGATWTDIGGSVYSGTLTNYTGNLNPLGGRPAFVGTAATATTTINVASTGAASFAPGSPVKVRFRIGSDSNTGANGWQVDNIAFSGITNQPFSTLIAQPVVTAAPVSVSGAVLDPSGHGIVRARVVIRDAAGNVRTVTTNSWGRYVLENLTAGEVYTISAAAKGYQFSPQVISARENLQEVNLIASN